MPYSYEEEKKNLFTEDGVRTILEIKKNVDKLLKTAGAFKVSIVMHEIVGDTWIMLAALDFLEELGIIRKIFSEGYTQEHIYTYGENR